MASGLIWHILAFVPMVWFGWRYFYANTRLHDLETVLLRFLSWPQEGPDLPLSLSKRVFLLLETELRSCWGIPSVKVLIPEKALQREAALKLWNLVKQGSPVHIKGSLVCSYNNSAWELIA